MKHELSRLWSRVTSLITRGVVTGVDDSKPTQTLQLEIRFEEIADEVEHLQPFGLSFHPPGDSEAAVLAAGAQDNLVAVGVTHRATRPTGVAEGEGGLYDADGWKVYLAPGKLLLGAEDATEAAPLGDKLKSAIDTYATAVTEAVALISYAGTGTISGSTAATALEEAATALATELTSALSQIVKVK